MSFSILSVTRYVFYVMAFPAPSLALAQSEPQKSSDKQLVERFDLN